MLGGLQSDSTAAFLSGILIGAECTSFVAQGKQCPPLILCGGGALAPLYQFAFERLGLPLVYCVNEDDGDLLALRGQQVLLKKWREE